MSPIKFGLFLDLELYCANTYLSFYILQMKKNIAKLRLVGIVMFALYFIIFFLRLFLSHRDLYEQDNIDWYKKPENFLILISGLCFLIVFVLQLYKFIITYYITKEDLINSPEVEN